MSKTVIKNQTQELQHIKKSIDINLTLRNQLRNSIAFMENHKQFFRDDLKTHAKILRSKIARLKVYDLLIDMQLNEIDIIETTRTKLNS